MRHPKVTTLITDLDNTLFDWVDLWFRCFSAMLDETVRISGVPRERLIPEIRAVHQRHGTSEYSLLLEELPSLRPVLKGRAAVEVFKSAIDAYRRQRREHLRLYPTVAETLLKIRGAGTRIVAYTESMAFYSNYRVRRLGLDGILDFIYSPEDHILPTNIDRAELRHYPASHYQLKYSTQRHVPKGSKKPDVLVLKSIMESLDLQPASCVYIGDSLMKDIAMAVDCGVPAVWAKYGIGHTRLEYELLRDVTHWSREDVERERKLQERVDVSADITLDNSFAQIMDHFDFGDHHGR